MLAMSIIGCTMEFMDEHGPPSSPDAADTVDQDNLKLAGEEIALAKKCVRKPSVDSYKQAIVFLNNAQAHLGNVLPTQEIEAIRLRFVVKGLQAKFRAALSV